jgi:hypothetical protein
MEWKHFEVVGGYDTYWKLDGRRLMNGDHVSVKWPDGHVEVCRVVVRKSEYHGRGGMDESTSTDMPHLVVDYHYSEACVMVNEEMEAQWVT